MSTPSAGLSAVVRVPTVPAALLVSALLVWQASNAAFSATTSNPGNSWTAGSVTLTDDDGGTSPTTGTAMFSAAGLVPGSTGSHCIAVTSTGTVPATGSPTRSTRSRSTRAHSAPPGWRPTTRLAEAGLPEAVGELSRC